MGLLQGKYLEIRQGGNILLVVKSQILLLLDKKSKRKSDT